jgi:hypothetical protein
MTQPEVLVLLVLVVVEVHRRHEERREAERLDEGAIGTVPPSVRSTTGGCPKLRSSAASTERA